MGANLKLPAAMCPGCELESALQHGLLARRVILRAAAATATTTAAGGHVHSQHVTLDAVGAREVPGGVTQVGDVHELLLLQPPVLPLVIQTETVGLHVSEKLRRRFSILCECISFRKDSFCAHMMLRVNGTGTHLE